MSRILRPFDSSGDGAATIEVEGSGEGALLPMTAADWQMVGEAGEIAKTPETNDETIGIFEDGSVAAFAENAEKGLRPRRQLPEGDC